MYMTVSVAQMQCLAGKDHFNLRVHICHRQEWCPGLPSQGSINTACDDHLKKKVLYCVHCSILTWLYYNVDEEQVKLIISSQFY